MPKFVVNKNYAETPVVDVPEIVDVKPLGSLVYIELLSPQECMNTKLDLGNSTEVTINQAVILGLGCRIPADYGLRIGQRVFISGPIVFGPDYGDYQWSAQGRKRGVVEYLAVKGEIVEKQS